MTGFSGRPGRPWVALHRRRALEVAHRLL